MNELKSSSDWQEVLHSADTFLFDCDGVIWNSMNVVPGAIEMVCHLQQLSKQVYFVTNKNTQSRVETLSKFHQLGFNGVTLENVFCSSYATAHYMKNVLKFNGTVYLIGQPGLKYELEEIGVKCLAIGPDLMTGDPKELEELELHPEVTAVVVGSDINFSYKKLAKAYSYLQNPDCHFIAACSDILIAVGNGRILPRQTGCFVEAIKYCSGREPTVIGKPCMPFMDCIQMESPFDVKRAVMIGDNLHTDIQFGSRAGLRTILVLSGVTKREEFFSRYDQLPSDMRPDYLTSSVSTLFT